MWGDDERQSYWNDDPRVDQLVTTIRSKRGVGILSYSTSPRWPHEHATRDPTTQQQGWRSDLVSPWRLDHTRGSRQDIHSTRVPGSPGSLWMARLPPQTTSDRTRPLRRLRTNPNMVAEPEMMYGLASLASSAPDEASRVALVIREKVSDDCVEVRQDEWRKYFEHSDATTSRERTVWSTSWTVTIEMGLRTLQGHSWFVHDDGVLQDASGDGSRHHRGPPKSDSSQQACHFAAQDNLQRMSERSPEGVWGRDCCVEFKAVRRSLVFFGQRWAGWSLRGFVVAVHRGRAVATFAGATLRCWTRVVAARISCSVRDARRVLKRRRSFREGQEFDLWDDREAGRGGVRGRYPQGVLWQRCWMLLRRFWKVCISKVPYDKILESLYTMRTRESCQLAVVLAMYEQEINQHPSQPRYQKLKTMVKRHLDRRIRTRNLHARNERMQTEVLVKTRKGKNVSVDRKQVGCHKRKARGQCTKGNVCSFRHNKGQRGKATQPSSFAPSMTEKVHREGNLREAAVLLERDIEDRAGITVMELFTKPSCNYWHSPVCQNYTSESGCEVGEKCMFRHTEVESQQEAEEKWWKRICCLIEESKELGCVSGYWAAEI